MSGVQRLIIFLGRIFLSVLFLFIAFNGLTNWDAMVEVISDKGIPNPQIYFIATKALYILGGLMLLFGWKTRIGAFILLIVLGTNTYFFYDFWNTQETEQMQSSLESFMMILGIIGGLLYVLACGAGCCCCDQTCNVDEDQE